MAAAEGYGAHQLSSLDSQLAEVEDILSYCSDVLTTGAGNRGIPACMSGEFECGACKPVCLHVLIMGECLAGTKGRPI